jgi:Metalloenzyme superfamily/Type I phosphodiesterase / nucleotide pyrophosphatase
MSPPARLAERWRRRGAVLLACCVLAAAARSTQRGLADAGSLFAEINIRSPRLAALPATSALASPSPTPAAPPLAAPPSRRVVLFVIDGLGEDRSHDLPALDELRRRGASTIAHSHLPSLSRPNYVSLLTGVAPLDSGVRSNDYAWEVPLDSLLLRVHKSARQTAFITDVAPGFGRMFAGHLSEATAAPWRNGLASAASRALERGFPFVVIIAGAVDDAGHRSGAASLAYRRAALDVDRQLGELVASLDLARDTILVTADHGHTAGGGHGGDEPEVMRVPVVLAGAGVRPAAQLTGARLVDLAPTIAALLGVPAPRHARGRTLVELLALSPTRTAALRAADHQRTAAIARFLAGAGDEGRPLGDRLFASFALALLLLFLVAAAARQRLLLLDRRVLLVAAATPLAATAALLISCGGELSLSSLANRAEGTRALLAAAAACTFAHLVAAAWALRRRPPLPRLRAAVALAGAALCLATFLTDVTAAFLGAPPWQHLPAAPLLLLLPLASMSLAISALCAGCSLAFELMTYFAGAGAEIGAGAGAEIGAGAGADPRLPV